MNTDNVKHYKACFTDFDGSPDENAPCICPLGKDKATPRPWKYESRDGESKGNKSGWGKEGLWGPNDEFILGDGEGWDSPFAAPSKANASLIVKAVNIHEELVEVLKDAIDQFQCDYAPGKLELIDKLQQALAKCEV